MHSLHLKKSNTKHRLLLIGFVIAILGLAFSRTNAVSSLFISSEVGGTNAAAMQLADTLDDSWRLTNDSLGAVYETATLSPAGATNATSLMTGTDGNIVSVSLRDLQNVANPLDLGTPTNTQGKLGSDTSATMQGDSPKPASHPGAYWNESAGSTSSQNGVLISFSQPTRAFGAWFGDVETRTDGNGAPALVRLYDSNGALIGSETVILPDEATQTNCGLPADNDYVGCGNNTTRWIGFSNDIGDEVSSMMIVVGDDDTDGDGGSEHLSLTGPTLVTGFDEGVIIDDPVVAAVEDDMEPADASVEKVTTDVVNNGPQDWTITYEVTVKNDGNVPIVNPTLVDNLEDGQPAGVVFYQGSASLVSDTLEPGPQVNVNILTYGASPGMWDVIDFSNPSQNFDLLPGDRYIVRISASYFIPDEPGEYVLPNIAVIDGDNIDEEEDGVTTTITVEGEPPEVAVSLDKEIVETAPYRSGDTITYKLTVANGGPDDASGVLVEDLLPTSVTYVSSSPTGEYDSVTGIWDPGNIAANSSSSADITVKINDDFSGDLANFAQVTRYNVGGTDTDANSDPGNNMTGIPTEDDEALLTVSVESDPDVSELTSLKRDYDVVATGDGTYALTYDIYVENTGDTDLTDLQVVDNLADALPAGAEVVSISGQYLDNSSDGTPTTVIDDDLEYIKFILASDAMTAFEPGDSIRVRVVVEFSVQEPGDYTISNIATSTANDPNDDLVTDTSDDSVDLVIDPADTIDDPTITIFTVKEDMEVENPVKEEKEEQEGKVLGESNTKLVKTGKSAALMVMLASSVGVLAIILGKVDIKSKE